MGGQQDHLDRVTAKIGREVVSFCVGMVQARHPPQFHMEELVAHIQQAFSAEGLDIAPDSPSRILRSLRQRAALNYTVISRRESLYEMIPLNGEARAESTVVELPSTTLLDSGAQAEDDGGNRQLLVDPAWVEECAGTHGV